MLRNNAIFVSTYIYYIQYTHKNRCYACMLQLNIAQCVIGASWFYLVRVFLTIQEVLCVLQTSMFNTRKKALAVLGMPVVTIASQLYS